MSLATLLLALAGCLALVLVIGAIASIAARHAIDRRMPPTALEWKRPATPGAVPSALSGTVDAERPERLRYQRQRLVTTIDLHERLLGVLMARITQLEVRDGADSGEHEV